MVFDGHRPQGEEIMDKLRKASKRLSVGSWSPFSGGEDKNASRTPSSASTGDFTDSSGRTSAPVVPASIPATANDTVAAVANNTSATSMVELAKIIMREGEKLEMYLRESGSPMPSFDIDGPANFPSLPGDMKKARDELLRATKDLEYLVTGPTEMVRWKAWDVSLLDPSHWGKKLIDLSLMTIFLCEQSTTTRWVRPSFEGDSELNSYLPAKSFPVNETATFAQIAEKVGLDEINLRRLLRHAMTNYIFKEVSPNVVAHTAASKVMAEDPKINDWVGFCLEDMWEVSVFSHSSPGSLLQCYFVSYVLSCSHLYRVHAKPSRPSSSIPLPTSPRRPASARPIRRPTLSLCS